MNSVKQLNPFRVGFDNGLYYLKPVGDTAATPGFHTGNRVSAVVACYDRLFEQSRTPENLHQINPTSPRTAFKNRNFRKRRAYWIAAC